MNYAIVVFFGFMSISAAWYAIHARKGNHSHLDANRIFICSHLANTISHSLQGAAGVRWAGCYFLKYSTCKVVPGSLANSVG